MVSDVGVLSDGSRTGLIVRLSFLAPIRLVFWPIVFMGGFAVPVFSYESLRESGFFSEEIVRHQGGGNQGSMFRRYSPQYPLWADGALKRRWIYMPRNTFIDTSTPDSWVFPVGTKVWKEFSFDEPAGNRKIETRLLEKLKDESWRMETFVWNEEQTEAVLAPDEGIKNHYALPGGKYYDVPGVHDCGYCHAKAGLDEGPKETPVLGFSALQLSDDRDPGAIHREPLEGHMLTLRKLEVLGRTTTQSDVVPAIPSSKEAPLQRPVLGYLHANCGSCHNEKGMSEFTTSLNFHHSADASYEQQNGTYKTAISKPITRYLQPAGSPEYVIDPGSPDTSALVYRMTEEHESYTFIVPSWHHNSGFSRMVGVKMPFVGTNVVDQEAVDKIREYIISLGDN